MFLSFALLLDAMDRRQLLGYLGIAVLLAFCLTTHPPTAIVLVVGLAALFLARRNDRPLITGLPLAGAVAAGVAGAVAWPYYSVVQLFVAQPH
jgi:4-amino-4-deoxy-L-arabinose transferase-like glycosyltransferase